MYRLDYFWQTKSANSGVPSFVMLKKQILLPQTTFKISEKINCKSWSLSIQDERNIFDRVMTAYKTIHCFSKIPAKIQKIYFFKRRRARSIFKKRLNNYVSFEIQVNTSLETWFSVLLLLYDFSKTICPTYKLPFGVFIKKRGLLLRFASINPIVLSDFFKNQHIVIKPQIFGGFCRISPQSVITADWIFKKLNETT